METTILEAGFLSAWERASGLMQEHRGKIEFLPVAAQRDRYPPLPLPATELSVFEPPDQEIGVLFSHSIAGIEDTLYSDSLNLLEDRLRGKEGSRAAHLRSQIGVLHARFGRDGEAEAELARRYSYLADSSSAQARAGTGRGAAGVEFSLIWDSGE